MSNNYISYIKKHQEYFFSTDDVDVTVLRGQLLLEEFLTKIISQFVFNSRFITSSKLTFSQKTHIARAISLDECENSMWTMISSINQLRNELVHKLPSENSDLKLKKLQQLYEKEADGSEFKMVFIEHGQLRGIQFSVVMCIGFLSSFLEEVYRVRNMVNELDKISNPHRYKDRKNEEK
ncbi:hypothetical protein CC99x_007760 [Candidatus Berkiella cookevillensis]|uniref:Cthe-2314-like HEPN domain-containing protein n=1 Tax=Candidatus Berkiella cookevillensis TaxID=437022 RepID=A0A0Q9YJJ4_9GAMM|nr:hypothetical protein [Candidatus Berkiella cookevillensis]MCS5708798.1 hypothetical protein [Candidatus Berkiella cookevillensis]